MLISYRVKEVISQLFSMIVQSRAMQDQVIDLESPISADKATTPLASIANFREPYAHESEQIAPHHEVRKLQGENPESMMREIHTTHVVKEHAPIMTLGSHDAEDGIGLQDEMKDLVAHGTSRDAGPITRSVTPFFACLAVL